MKKIFYLALANFIFLFHFILIFIALFGWTKDRLWWVYISVLILTLISDLTFGYCILSKWEFSLRKKIHPEIDYDYTWTTFYTYEITNFRISNSFYKKMAVFFLVTSLVLSFYFKFMIY